MGKKLLIVHNMPDLNTNPSGVFVYEQFNLLMSANSILDCEIYSLRKHKLLFMNYLSCISLIKLIRRSQPDVVHVHYGLNLIPVFLASIFLPKVKYVCTFHGSDLLGGRLIRWFCNLFCYLLGALPIIVSRNLEPKLWKLHKRNLHIIPCALNLPRESLKVERKLTILFPGDPLRDVKNFPAYVELMKKLQGNGTCVKTLFLTNISKDLVLGFMQEADALVIVSKWEGSPQVVKEALSVGLPIYALDVGDVSAVTAGIKGCHVEHTVEALVMQLMAAPVAHSLDAECCNQKLEPFKPAIVLNKLIDVYQIND